MTTFKPITDQEDMFVAEYVIDFNCSRASQAVGFSPTTGQKLLKEPRIMAEIYAAKHKVVLRAGISADQTLERLNMIAEVDPTDAIKACLTCTNNAELAQAICNLPENVRFAIKSFEITRNGPKLQFHDKTAAIGLLGKYFKLFVDKFEMSGPNGGPLETVDHSMTPEKAQQIYADMLKADKEGK